MNIKDVVSLIQKSKAAMLATVNHSGYPEIRALLNLADEKKYPVLKDKALVLDGEKLSLYFTTNTSSRKIEQLRFNPKVSLYYCIPEKFLGACLTGTIEEVTDEAVKKDFWQTGWRIYYHKGSADPDYTLLKFTSEHIHCWGEFSIHDFGDEK